MRAFDWDPIRAEHYGQRLHRRTKQAGHMTAPDQCCSNSESSCQGGFPVSALVVAMIAMSGEMAGATRKNVRCRLAQTSRVRCSNPKGRTMSEFTFLFRGSDPTAQSPGEMQKSMQKWHAWFKELGEKGHIKYPGHPLERAGKVVRGKQKSVHDGPYAEAKDIVNGFTLIEAKDLPHAVELSKGCTILEAGGSVEVRPIRIMDM